MSFITSFSKLETNRVRKISIDLPDSFGIKSV